jgi:hypothetical protein
LSLLGLAIDVRDIRSTTVIINVWLEMLNQGNVKETSWMVVCIPTSSSQFTLTRKTFTHETLSKHTHSTLLLARPVSWAFYASFEARSHLAFKSLSNHLPNLHLWP